LGFAFIVLIVGGISIVMQPLLGVSNVTALIITLVFVTTYVMYGGTYAHVYTNMFQGFLMIVVSLLIVGSGFWLMFVDDPGLFARIYASKPHLLDIVNEQSRLFNSPFAVYISGFLIGAALVCQPHILTKALYVKQDRDVGRYIAVFAVVYILFTMLLLAGFWAISVVPESALIDATTGAFRQDLVMTAYLKEVFPDWVFSIISIVLLAAAMSTLDGLLIGMSTITSNDLVLNLLKRKNAQKAWTAEKQMQIANKSAHVVLVVIAILTFIVNLNPPKLLGIFGQVGVYGLVLAAVPPLLNGVLFKNSAVRVVWILAVVGMVTHFFLYFYG
jgi:SSS family solute:Na+ symporter/sodium/pantothenate symporter